MASAYFIEGMKVEVEGEKAAIEKLQWKVQKVYSALYTAQN
jgi:hypothetical protein